MSDTLTRLPETAETFDVTAPRTGDVVGTWPQMSASDVAVTVAETRLAAQWWAALPFDERARRLDAFRGILTRRMAQLAHLVHEETGKPHSDAMLEIGLVLDHVRWAAHSAKKVLGPRRAPVGLLTFNQAASVEYPPMGVVGVIGPWNYPVFTPLGSVVYALAAGNAVVFKPSELTTGTGAWLVDAFQQAVPEQPAVLSLVTGDGRTGHALCRSDVDKVAFTGSTATAKKVMATCAETLTPVVAECGGKDALIVDADADLDAAAAAALWAGMANAGQSCIGTERVLVHQDVHDRFVELLVARARELRAGVDDLADIGPITMPRQAEVIRDHLVSALASGARAVLGGDPPDADGVMQPTILVDVLADCVVDTEETFGPILTVARVRDMDEAVQRANSTRYGLAVSIFSKRDGMRIARGVRTGMACVNAVFTVPQIPTLPFGGVDDSGFGRIHGEDGLREFTYAKAIARQRFKPLMELTSFARTAKTDELVGKLLTVLHGKRQPLD